MCNGDALPPARRVVPEKQQAMADLITQEMDELQEFVSLCRERIGLLMELQANVDSGFNITLPESHVRALTEKFPLMSEVVLEDKRAPSGSADDYLVAKKTVRQDSPMLSVHFLGLKSPRAPGSSSPSPAPSIPTPTALLVANREDGHVVIFSPTGELLTTFDAGHAGQAFQHLAVSQSPDNYFVATGDAAGEIRVHRISVRQRRLSEDEKKERRKSTDAKLSQHYGPQLNVTVQSVEEMQLPTGSNGEPPRLTALAVASSKHLVAGDGEGKVSFFTRNGTFRGSVDATTTPGGVEGLHAHPGAMLFRAGAEWGFVNAESLEITHVDCPQFEGSRIVAAAVDAQQSTRVLVADDEGTIWVLNLKDKRTCKVDHRFPGGAAPSIIELGSVRGFALGLETASSEASSPSGAAIFALNMTHVGKRSHDLLRAGEPTSPVVWRKERGVVRDWSVFKRHQQGDLLAFLSEDGHEIEIMELLMQVYAPPPTTDSFGNFQFPVIATAIVLVLGYQYFKQKGKFEGGGDKGKNSNFDRDLAALRDRKKWGDEGSGGLGDRKLPRPRPTGGLGSLDKKTQ